MDIKRPIDGNKLSDPQISSYRRTHRNGHATLDVSMREN